MVRPIRRSVPRLLPRQLVSAVLASLLSLLSFAVIVQTSQQTSQQAARIGHGVSAGEGGDAALFRLLQPLRMPPLIAQLIDSAAVAVDDSRMKQKATQQTAKHRTQHTAPQEVGARVRDGASTEPVPYATHGAVPEVRSESVRLPDTIDPVTSDPGVSHPGASRAAIADTAEAARTNELAGERAARAAGYLPAADLSERPVLLQDIHDEIDLATIMSAEDDLTAITEATGILLINEQGGVDRLLFESPGLPQYLESLLAQRFAEARFRPGKIDGRPVRSALRIVLQLQ